MGTLSVFKAVPAVPSVKAQLIATTGKVYRNLGLVEGFVESDALGEHDP